LMGQPMQAFPMQDHQAHIQAHLAIMATPPVQANVAIAAALQGHIQEHIGLLAEQKAQEQVMSQIPPEQQQMLQQDPNMQQQIQIQVQAVASKLIGEMIEQYAQTVTPPNQGDPLVEIRKQELSLKGADIQRKEREFEQKQEMQKQSEQTDAMLERERINIAQQALNEKTRVAEDRIQTQRDIAALNASRKG
jgi:hypothetical protein